MTAPDSVPLWVVSGNPTAEELAAVVAVLGAIMAEGSIHRSAHSARERRPAWNRVVPPVPVSSVSWATAGHDPNKLGCTAEVS